jgi:hypothetical protein
MLVPLTLALALGALPDRDDGAISAFALSPDQGSTAVFDSKEASLTVYSESDERSLPMPELDWPAGSAQPALSWSEDSRYIAVEGSLEEDATALEIVDAKTMSVVWKGNSAGAAWLRQGHRMLVVPAYEISGPQQDPGLLLVDPMAGSQRRIANGTFFMGHLEAGRTVVVADTVRTVDGVADYSLARIDLGEELAEPDPASLTPPPSPTSATATSPRTPHRAPAAPRGGPAR